MQPVAAVAIFCEDIRKEKSGQDIIIGGSHRALSFDSCFRMAQLCPLQAWAPEVVEKAFLDARATGMPLVGLVLKIVAAPLAIRMAGKIVAIVNVNDSDYVAGALNVIVLDPSAPRA
jgi:hypothetical protein